jgi:hypothetical protein
VFAKLTTAGITVAAASPDLIAIGSAPNERTVEAQVFAKGWNGAWKGRAAVLSSIARLAPGGTTGWVVAHVELAKTGYKIQFMLFCVFDKTAAGAWRLVHAHFGV